MKIQIKDKIIEVKEKSIISEALKNEIEKSKYTVIGAIYNNEYVDLNYRFALDKDDLKLTYSELSASLGPDIFRAYIRYGTCFDCKSPGNAGADHRD